MVDVPTQPIILSSPSHQDWHIHRATGVSYGQDNSGTSCPSGHSKEFCRGWDAGAAGSSSSSNNNPTIGSSRESSIDCHLHNNFDNFCSRAAYIMCSINMHL